LKSPDIILLLTLIFGLSTSPLYAKTVTLTPKEALQLFFEKSERVVSEKKEIDTALRDSIEKRLGAPFKKKSIVFYLGKTGKKTDGYALIDSQIGKTEPITFMTLIDPSGRVKTVEILVYRESHGGEVRSKRFLRQFTGKKMGDRLELGRGIANISGATLSARAMSRGVKRALILWDIIYGQGVKQ